MTISHEGNTATVVQRKRMLIFCGAGAVLILAGALAPKLIPLPLMSVTPSEPQLRPTSGSVETKAGGSAEEPAKVASSSGTDPMGSIERLLTGAMVVLVGGAIAAWFFRNRGWKKPPSGATPLNVTGALQLHHRCCIYLIETQQRRFLAGVDGSGLKSWLALPNSESTSANEAAIGLFRPNQSKPVQESTVPGGTR